MVTNLQILVSMLCAVFAFFLARRCFVGYVDIDSVSASEDYVVSFLRLLWSLLLSFLCN